MAFECTNSGKKIGGSSINALPYKLVGYLDANLTMIVLVIDIPLRYGMFLSRKLSVAMGGSL